LKVTSRPAVTATNRDAEASLNAALPSHGAQRPASLYFSSTPLIVPDCGFLKDLAGPVARRASSGVLVHVRSPMDRASTMTDYL
jgi:hypothetical protein